MTSQPTLILVAGGPGAGKTAFGRALAMRLPATILVDKDVLASPWIDPVLARLHDGQVDRDSETSATDGSSSTGASLRKPIRTRSRQAMR